MKYKIFKLARTQIGTQSIIFLEDIGDHISWTTDDWDSDMTDNSFNSVQEAKDKMTELYTRETKELWLDLSINKHNTYTIIPVI